MNLIEPKELHPGLEVLMPCGFPCRIWHPQPTGKGDFEFRLKPWNFVPVSIMTVSMQTDHSVKCLYQDMELDEIYLLDKDNGGNYKLLQWNAHSSNIKTLEWGCKIFEFPDTTNFGCAQILGAQTISKPVTFQFYTGQTDTDMILRFTKKVKEYPFPILDPDRMEVFPAHMVNAPAGMRTEDWIKGWQV